MSATLTADSLSFLFGTKAQTLSALAPLLKTAGVLPIHYFTVADWTEQKSQVLQNIQRRFSNQLLAIRSSALVEDGLTQSCAGTFVSLLNVNSASLSELTSAIQQVVDSYAGHPEDQVLIQPMLLDTVVSGVMTTHVLNDGAPYYVINYDDESGKTDTITGGTGVNKTVLIHRNTRNSLIESERIGRWLALIQELESLCGELPLDIEFAQTKTGALFVLQVRALTVQRLWNRSVGLKIETAQSYIESYITEHAKKRPGLAGSRTILGEMPDWNPAEMIGTSPRPLASSLYRKLITDEVWREARGRMGYRNPKQEKLMLMLGGHPYIDVRNSFNSFLPAKMPDRLANKLVNAWLDRLDQHPELHDKVEFEVAQTVLDFEFAAKMQAYYGQRFSGEEIQCFQAQLRELTKACLDLSEAGTLTQSLNLATQLQSRQKKRHLGSFKFRALVPGLYR